MLFSYKHKNLLTMPLEARILRGTRTGDVPCPITMLVEFQDHDLDRLETDAAFAAGFPTEIVRAYRRRLQAIRAAVDERDLYVFASWRFKKLRGDRSHQRSIRLNDQWRLIVEIIEARPSNVMLIIGIEDYH